MAIYMREAAHDGVVVHYTTSVQFPITDVRHAIDIIEPHTINYVLISDNRRWRRSEDPADITHLMRNLDNGMSHRDERLLNCHFNARCIVAYIVTMALSHGSFRFLLANNYLKMQTLVDSDSRQPLQPRL